MVAKKGKGGIVWTERQKSIHSIYSETPLLAIATQITQINETTIRLTFVTAERKAVNLHLTEDMLHAVCYIMQTAADRAGWDLKLSVGDAAAVPQIEAGQVH